MYISFLNKLSLFILRVETQIKKPDQSDSGGGGRGGESKKKVSSWIEGREGTKNFLKVSTDFFFKKK